VQPAARSSSSKQSAAAAAAAAAAGRGQAAVDPACSKKKWVARGRTGPENEGNLRLDQIGHFDHRVGSLSTDIRSCRERDLLSIALVAHNNVSRFQFMSHVS
jgi:hypothetical protein